MKQYLIILMFFSSLLGFSQTDSTTNSDWTFDVSPSAWIGGSGIDIRTKAAGLESKANFSGVFDDITIGFSIHLEARFRDYFVFNSISFWDLEKQENLADLGGKTTLTTSQLFSELAVGKNLINWQEWLLIDGFLGLRGLDIENEIQPELGPKTSETLSYFDPFLGLRLRTINEKSFKSMRLDLGGFGVGSETAWKANIIGGHRFTPSFSAHVGLQAQGLYYEESNYSMNLNATGILLGINLRL